MVCRIWIVGAATSAYPGILSNKGGLGRHVVADTTAL